MKVIVISDTHIPITAPGIPPALHSIITQAEMLIHAGDFVSTEFYEQLSRTYNLIAVAGNMDDPAIRQTLPQERIFEIGGNKIGLIHGNGSPQSTFQLIQERFQHLDVKAVVFGHTHQAYNEYHKGKLLFNPGSLLDRRFSPFCSYGVLTIGKNEIKGKIIRI